MMVVGRLFGEEREDKIIYIIQYVPKTTTPFSHFTFAFHTQPHRQTMNTGKQDLIDEKGEAAAAASEKKRPGSLLAPPPGTNKKQHQVRGISVKSMPKVRQHPQTKPTHPTSHRK